MPNTYYYAMDILRCRLGSLHCNKHVLLLIKDNVITITDGNDKTIDAIHFAGLSPSCHIAANAAELFMALRNPLSHADVANQINGTLIEIAGHHERNATLTRKDDNIITTYIPHIAGWIRVISIYGDMTNA